MSWSVIDLWYINMFRMKFEVLFCEDCRGCSGELLVAGTVWERKVDSTQVHGVAERSITELGRAWREPTQEQRNSGPSLVLHGRAHGVKDFSCGHDLRFHSGEITQKSTCFHCKFKKLVTRTVFAFANVFLDLSSFQAFFESDWVTLPVLDSSMILYRKRSCRWLDPTFQVAWGALQRVSRSS